VGSAVLLFAAAHAFVARPLAQDVEVLKTGIVKVIRTSPQGQQETGTGFVVRQEPGALHIVTASHVVENAAKIEVEFYTRRNRPVPVRLVQIEGADPRGIALLLCETQIPNVTPLALREPAAVRGGEPVVTIGFPLASNVPWAVITGTLIGRSGRVLTFSGALDGGSSGGPLIRDGAVIGIVTEVTAQTGYAVPAQIARYTLDGWGVSATDAGPPLAGASKGPASPVVKSLENTQITFISDRSGTNEIYAMNVDGSNVRRLTSGGGWMHSWSPDASRIAFLSKQSVHVMNADGSDPRLLIANTGDGGIGWSPDGRRIAFEMKGQIAVMDPDGKGARLLTRAGGMSPSWSPDGTKIAFAGWRNKTYDIYALNADATIEVNLTNSPAIHYNPAWSPDGTRIAFESNREGPFEIYVMNADGTNVRRLTRAGGGAPSWSPDGTKIVFIKRPAEKEQADVYVMNADGSGAVNLTNNRAYDSYPKWSPYLRRLP
jgi:TolB protein